MSQQHAVLLLGSNLGNREKNLAKAIELLERKEIIVIKKSKIIKSNPVEFVSKNFFCNIALSIYTRFSPINLVKEIKEIEKKMGRYYDTVQIGSYTDRIIDIDIVKYMNIKFVSKILNLPHEKHLNERIFSQELLKNLTNDK